MNTQYNEIESFVALAKMIGCISLRGKIEEDEREFCIGACPNCPARSLAKAYCMPTDF
jgi:hypothetical protein